MPDNIPTMANWQLGDDEAEEDEQIRDLLSLRDCLRVNARFSDVGALFMARRVDGAIKSLREQAKNAGSHCGVTERDADRINALFANAGSDSTKARWIRALKMGVILSCAVGVLSLLAPSGTTISLPFLIPIAFLMAWANEGAPGV